MTILKRNLMLAMTLATVAAATPSIAVTVNMTANTGFSGDGWLAPGENGGLSATDNLARGMAVNKTNGHVLLASRTGGNLVRVLDSAGNELSQLNMTGVTGGTFVINKVAVGDDGRIYVANLTTNATTSPFKIYRWDNESSAPVVVYSGEPLAGARMGDSMDAIGSGANTRLVFGYSNSPAVTGNNGYNVFTEDGTGNLVANHFGFPLPTPAAGDHRLGVTFVDSDTIIGGQNSSIRLSDFTIGGTATYLGSPVISSAVNNQRAFDVTTVNGTRLLATLDSGVAGTTLDGSNNPNGNLAVRIFDITDPMTPTLLAIGVIPTAGVANSNASGEVKFGAVNGNSVTVYGMATNNGIQSFNVQVVPEPATMLAMAAGISALAARRRKK